MNCDRIAPFYRWIEYAAFGRLLHRARCCFLEDLGSHSRVLVIGDGDGRYLSELARRHPGLEIDAVEASAGMIALAARRAPGVRIHHADARHWIPPKHFDLVVTHFFLDCLSEEDLAGLVQRVSAALDPGARWIVSEFAVPDFGWRRLRARAWLRAMYLFFGAATGLRVRQLPDHAAVFERHGLMRECRQTFSAGLISAEAWRLTSSGRSETLPSPADHRAECP